LQIASERYDVCITITYLLFTHMKALLYCDCSGKWGAYAPLVLRVATGLVFAMHGYQKLTQMGVDGVAGFLGSLGFPLATFFAVILIAVELLGGVALILGLFTHWAAKLTAIVALVALLTVHASKGFFISEGGIEFILVLLAASISLMISGAGAFSLDGRMKRA
jgi:putative oxidoreductase